MHLPLLSSLLSRPAMRALCRIAILAPASTLAADLSLDIAHGPTGEATLYASLHNNAASYADGKPMAAQTAPMRDGKARLVFPGLAPGHYALRVFADENGNGKLDTNLIGLPTERYGFSNDAKGKFGAPDFDAAAIRVDAADLQAVIHLH
ncbi:DUF2141 domain-containing protein [Verminephrobacter aporrectodeae subsp. tuberculatae]|uniref:DUF2141 domain-containing protein n=1 Tax=Verminephrobacter aporrectodeae TaxID=1110389 RepID=UPI0022439B26|nr:DUF2141 domain-containing protein [Verminephrobacter aporrectodeae]MCW8164334.1 DUF2141 domain-containing protein [Verminephrobacter aporrectodeae subsp. tuberculatae]MCW8168588.1 DUF2141 domain-containing protein [Verminephrobacter aporrectodeae subsp. tuberculatae]